MWLAGVTVVLVSTLVWRQYLEIESDRITSALDSVTRELASLQREIDQSQDHAHFAGADRALSARGVDTRYSVLVSTDETGRIMHSIRRELRGEQAAAVLAGFHPERAARVQIFRRADVLYEPKHHRIVAYFPLALTPSSDGIRPAHTGTLFAVYDLSAERATVWDLVWHSNFDLWAFPAIAMLVTIGFLQRFVTRPIDHLVSTANALAEGTPGALARIDGSGELARLASAFNAMSLQLEDRSQKRRMAEEALRKSEEFLKDTGRTASVGGWEIDVESLDVCWTEEAFHIYDLPIGEPPTIDEAIEYVHPHERSNVRAAVDEAIATGVPFEMENRFVTAKGLHRWIHTICKPVCVDGKTVKLTGTFQDITERKNAAKELDQYEQVVSNTADSFALIDQHYTYLFINPAGARLFGVSPSQIVGTSAVEMFDEKVLNSVIKPYADRCLAGENVQFQEWFEYPAAGRRYMDVTYSPYVAKDTLEPGIVLTSQDRTVEKLLEERLQQSQKMEAIGLLAGGIAHDFNNMLAIILGQTDLALREVEPTQPIGDNLRQIRSAVEHSAALTRQLLGFASKQNVIPVALDLNDTVTGMLEMMSRLIGENIEIAWVPGKGLWTVTADPSQIDQILANLCVNARDAIEGPGKITIETQNVVLDEEQCAQHVDLAPGEYVMLAVSDNGEGMNEEVVAKLFIPFFTTKEVGQGTGLGMSMVYGIVKQNNGLIEISSRPGEGSTFQVYLPRTQSGPPSLQAQIPVDPETTTSANECVLVVEDNAMVLRTTKTMLERHKYTVLAASTPQEASRLAEEHRDELRLVITDVLMPEMSGPQLAAELKARNPTLKLLFMSGYTDAAMTDGSLLIDAAHFIQKPFTMADLVAKVHEALHS